MSQQRRHLKWDEDERAIKRTRIEEEKRLREEELKIEALIKSKENQS